MSVLWVFDQQAKERKFKITNPLISNETILAMDCQKFLKSLYEQCYWIACSCRDPNALMYIRKKSNDDVSLVNHSEHGLHDVSCGFFSIVKGAPRESIGLDEQGAGLTKRNSVLLYRDYRTNEATTPSNSESESNKNVDSLVRLVWQFADDSFNQYYHRKDITPLNRLMKIRDQASEVKLGKHGNLKDSTFVGAKGLHVLKQIMKQRQTSNPNIRHQALLLMNAKMISYKNEGVRIEDEYGSISYIDNVYKKAITVNRLGIDDTPCLVALAFCFDGPSETQLSVHKWSVFSCLSSKRMMIVNSLYERICLQLCHDFVDSKVLVSENDAIYVVKPVVPFEDGETSLTYTPNMIIVSVINDVKMRYAIEILESNAIEYLQEAESKNDLHEKNFDKVLSFPLYKFTTAATIISEFVHLLEMEIDLG